MYYIYKKNTEEIFISEKKPSDYTVLFEVDELPLYPPNDNAEVTLMADFETKKVWYDVREIEKSDPLVTINENILIVMEGMAAAYEEQRVNDMNIMEGLAAIYETQIGGI